MLKEKKIDFQRGCEEYIEEQGLYEIFEDMMRSLIINKPQDPLKFLIDRLEKPESKYRSMLRLQRPCGGARPSVVAFKSATFKRT